MHKQFISVVRWSAAHSDIIKVVLDYSAKRNCLSKAVMLELTHIINDINKMSNVKVIVVTHKLKESKVFSSGHDLNEMYNNINNKQELESIFKICNTLMITIHESQIPIIAMINGYCTAAGFELALACDLIICSNNSKFQTPGANLGIFCHTPSVQLSRTVYSNKHAMQLLLTGDYIDASNAYRMGIVNFVCKTVDELYNKTQEIALKICCKSKSVIAFGKQSYFAHSKEKHLKDAYKIASKNMVDNLMSYGDAKEGINAFLTKRKPNWNHQCPSSKL